MTALRKADYERRIADLQTELAEIKARNATPWPHVDWLLDTAKVMLDAASKLVPVAAEICSDEKGTVKT